jgi:hypothetical protein
MDQIFKFIPENTTILTNFRFKWDNLRKITLADEWTSSEKLYASIMIIQHSLVMSS